MSSRYAFISFLATLLLIQVSLFAQRDDSKRISGNFKNLKIDEFVHKIESTTNYHFYYDSLQFDSLIINTVAKDQPLAEVLKQIFLNTDFRYAIDPDKNVFLIKAFRITTTLPPGLFKNGTVEQSEVLPDQSIGNFGDDKIKVVQQATLENKLYEIGIRTNNLQPGNANLAGYIRDDKTGEPVIGVSLYIDKPRIGITTDQYGYYSISLPKGRHTLNIESLGKKDTKRQIMLYSDGKLNIELHEQVLTLKEVIISASKAKNIQQVQLGIEKINIKSIKQVPTVFGESDILRVVLTLPGVKSVGEASTGFNVRGGAADQNLILFNDATIYNPSHFFGFFSAFNPEVVKDVELYKSSIPPRFGGRLSSVLDISGREGNKRNFAGSAGIGIVTTRFNIEGPITRDKTSFIFGGRTTYANWLMRLLPKDYKKSRASFYDMNLLVSHQLNKKNNLYFTGYLSQDRFNLNSDTTYGYGNNNLSLKWKHEFNNKMYSVVTGGYDMYRYNISSDQNPLSAYELGFDIHQANLKADFSYYINLKHSLNFGGSAIRYSLHPGLYKPLGGGSLVIRDEIPAEHGIESAIYAGDNYNITPKLSVNYGFRFSMFNYLGPQNINRYAPGLPKSETTRLDSIPYNSGKIIKSYGGPEYRLAVRYILTDNLSLKVGYNSLRQYIHMLTNSTAISPTDIWKLSDPNIKPEKGDQISFGIYRNFKSNTIETSIEAYYKRLKDYPDYKSGAVLVMNHYIETDLLNTKGKAYGIEFMMKKSTGKLNGWISYTYSRTLLQTSDTTSGEVINRGNYYPANFDKPHDVTFVGNYRLSHRFSISFNAVYSTGRPITLPIGRYSYGGSQRALYSDRNAYRIPDYFRTDFSMNIEGNHKVKQKTHNSWTIGIYNLTGRKNAYSTYFISENGVINGYKLSIFGSAIPFLNFNIRF